MMYLKADGRILDLGCGSGRDSIYFISKGYDALPVDGCDEMVRLSRINYGLSTRLLLFNQLDYVEEFDGIFACASLLHLNSTQYIMCKIIFRVP